MNFFIIKKGITAKVIPLNILYYFMITSFSLLSMVLFWVTVASPTFALVSLAILIRVEYSVSASSSLFNDNNVSASKNRNGVLSGEWVNASRKLSIVLSFMFFNVTLWRNKSSR